MGLLIGFLAVRDTLSLSRLKKEVDTVKKLDITKDRYDRKVKSHGKYAKVERAIKEYFDSYAVGMQEISDMANDKDLAKVLSYDNYNSDGPDFVNSISFLDNNKESFNTKIDDLLVNLDENAMNDFIYNYTKDAYYVSLYRELMSDNEIKAELNDIKNLLLDAKKQLNNVYDVSLDVLNYLKVYKDKWHLEEGEIKFQTEEMYNYYMALISKISQKKDE